jgi:zinc transport system substrate-binding protein
MRSKKLFFLFGTLFAIGFALAIYIKSQSSQKISSQKDTFKPISVIASFYPMAYFTQQVGGHLVDVQTLVRPGLEPHDFEPSPQDMVRIQKAQLFVYNGAGLEGWAPKIIQELPKEKVVNTTEKINLLPASDDQGSTNEKTLSYDPHVWVNPHTAIEQVTAITDGLVTVDPSNQEIYTRNATAFTEKLKELDNMFSKGLANCQQRTIVTSHNAFAYLARQYNLQVLSISGLSPDEEPSAKKLAEISTFVEANDVQYIFFESLVSPKLSETIAQETGAKTLSFNPLEGLTEEETQKGENYFTVQEQNLKNLQQALECR